jgi:hypothetical protein
MNTDKSPFDKEIDRIAWEIQADKAKKIADAVKRICLYCEQLGMDPGKALNDYAEHIRQAIERGKAKKDGKNVD